MNTKIFWLYSVIAYPLFVCLIEVKNVLHWLEDDFSTRLIRDPRMQVQYLVKPRPTPRHFTSTRNTYINPNQKNQNQIWTFIQKYPNGIYELSILVFGYNPNRTEIRTRIWKYPKLVKYVNVFIYFKKI